MPKKKGTVISVEKKMGNFSFVQQKVKQRAHPSWYRGDHCNFNPVKSQLAEVHAVDNYILHGWLPPKPFIDKKTKITVFGSCFAQHISRYLHQKGYTVPGMENEDAVNTRSYVIRCGGGMVNSFALLQQFEWAFLNKKLKENLWYDSQGEIMPYNTEVKDDTRRLFLETDVFIITLGLSEVWCNKSTGEVYWKAIPIDKFDERIHGFRISSVQENQENIERVVQLIANFCPSAKIVFTLSPVPLVATFRPVSCMTANLVSKSILRVAIDEVCRTYQKDKDFLYYFPSYEIIKEYISDPYEEDSRHIKQETVTFIMEHFERHYCYGEVQKK